MFPIEGALRMKFMRFMNPAAAVLLGVCLCAARPAVGQPAPIKVTPAMLADVERALPEAGIVQPLQARRLLIFKRIEGWPHPVTDFAAQVFERMGEKTGAFAADIETSMDVFTPENLARYDAILFDNTTGLAFENPAHRRALMDFVEGGKGIVGIHAATDNFRTWPEAQALMGGVFDGHPWKSDGVWAVKIDEPDHPLNASFGGAGFMIHDEIYQVKGPYTRDRLRVLLSLDMTNPANAGQEKVRRADGDFAIAWIQPWGAGRVFYCSLGHNAEVYWNPPVLRHYLSGIQYALGDLPLDDRPSAQLEVAPEPALTTRSIPPNAPLDLFEEGAVALWTGDTPHWVMADRVAADPENPARLSWDAGTRIAALPEPSRAAGELRTVFGHGDVALRMEYLLPAGSGAALFFQDRYELPLQTDSSTQSQWHTLEARFRAPRFDAAGTQTESARFDKVEIDGRNVAATVESSAAAARGPLRIDGGPVALRGVTLAPLDGDTLIVPLNVTRWTLSVLTGYEFGTHPIDLTPIEQSLRMSPPKETRWMAQRLTAVATNPAATRLARQRACELLARAGDDETVAALAPLLADDSMANPARTTLQALATPDARAALRAALDRADGEPLIGLINALSELRDEGSVDALARLARGNDKSAATAAIDALGTIGTPDAARAMEALPPPMANQPATQLARLRAADALGQFEIPAWRAIAGKALFVDWLHPSPPRMAFETYRDLSRPDAPMAIRSAALRGLAMTERGDFAGRALDLLDAPDPALGRAARQILIDLPGPDSTRAIARQLWRRRDRLSTSSQAQALAVLGARGDAAARPVVLDFMRADETPDGARAAAIAALETVGDARDIPELLRGIGAGSESGRAAYLSVVRMPGEAVEAAILERLPHAKPAGMACCLQLLRDRRAYQTVPVAREYVNHANEEVAWRAIQAVGTLGEPGDVATLASALASAPSEKLRQTSIESLVERIRWLDDPGAGVGELGQILNDDDAALADAVTSPVTPRQYRMDLVNVVAQVGSEAAVAALAGQLDATDPSVRDASVRGLAAMDVQSAAPILLTLACEAETPAQRVLALRGFIRLAGLPDAGEPTGRIERYRAAWELASAADEKRQIVAGLQSVGSPAALEMLAIRIDDPDVSHEAALAVFALTESPNPDAMPPAAARQALEAAAEKALLAEDRETARQTLAPPAEVGSEGR
jgi:type 1 glutamine amidotransferase/HEAT repeat protein